MKFISSILVLAVVGLATAAPAACPKEKGPPPPPAAPGDFNSASLSCSASQSSISCCNQAGSPGGKNGKPGPAKAKNVYYQDNVYNLQCSQIDTNNTFPMQSICSTTVACCQGAGCIAIAN